MENIILIGMGGHAKGVVDTIERQKRYNIVGFIDKDNNNKNTMYNNYEVIGCDDDLSAVFARGGG